MGQILVIPRTLRRKVGSRVRTPGWGEKVGRWSPPFVALFGDCPLGELSIFLGSPRPALDLEPVWDLTSLGPHWSSRLTRIP